MNRITFTKENYGYEASSTIVIINSYLQFMTVVLIGLYIYISARVLSTAVGLCMMAMWFKPKTWLLGRKRFNRIYITKIQTRGSIPIDSTTA